jgi:hypothetical protein
VNRDRGARRRPRSDTTNVNSVPGYLIGNLMVDWDNPNWDVQLNVKTSPTDCISSPPTAQAALSAKASARS